MILVIDAGNSRIKWAVFHGTAKCGEGAVDHADIAALAAAWSGFTLSRAVGASVVQPALRRRIDEQAPCPIVWIQTTDSAAGVRNHYVEPAQMGVDRWLAVLAARRLVAGDVIVASAGTALTIESLTAEGDYLGGLIMPGYRVMLAGLAGNTARLDQPVGEWSAFPTCTGDALETGVLEAMAGAIERARQRLAARTGRPLPPVLLSGGDASRVVDLLASPCQIVDNLVLTGLLEVADKT
ncbi:type III pantothenate kinase [Paludibacterium purpuratum]|uniref:Type III pantothenate kinase n=1 Tax=Paludibacterium purpuratum TaxID=1144873 RepID=A0A4R7B737_9NEIS|nr:type III pantothenate kinase [Paludibacterium purpuratum]TDR80511.1 type III pantothenate kinase [Paludibacterium purpuratum]